MRPVLEDGVRSVKLVRVSRNVMRIENLLNPLPSSCQKATTSCPPSLSKNADFSGLDALATAAAGCTRIPPRIISASYKTCTSMTPRIAPKDQTGYVPPNSVVVNARRPRSNSRGEIQTNLADLKRHRNFAYRDTRIFICRVPSCRQRSLGIYRAEQHDKKAHNPKDVFVKRNAKAERQKVKELERKTLRFMPWKRHALKGSTVAMRDSETSETVTGTATVDSGKTVQAPYEIAKRVKPNLPFVLWDMGGASTEDCPGGSMVRWKITI